MSNFYFHECSSCKGKGTRQLIGFIGICKNCKGEGKIKIYYCVVSGKESFISLAKKEPFTSQTPNPISEPGDLWFEIGSTPEDAINKLMNSLKKEVI